MLSMETDGATIKSISENIVVNPGDEAKLSCAVDGKFVGESFFCHHFALLCFDGFCFAKLSTGLITVMENGLRMLFRGFEFFSHLPQQPPTH